MNQYRLSIIILIALFCSALAYNTSLCYGAPPIPNTDPECRRPSKPSPVPCAYTCTCNCSGVETPTGQTVTGEKEIACEQYAKFCSTRRKGPVATNDPDPETVPFQPHKPGDTYYKTSDICEEPAGGACCCSKCAKYEWVDQYDIFGNIIGQKKECVKTIWINKGDNYKYTITNNWQCYELPDDTYYCNYYEDLPEGPLTWYYKEAYFKDECNAWGDPVLGPFEECEELPSDPCDDCSLFVCPPPPAP